MKLVQNQAQKRLLIIYLHIEAHRREFKAFLKLTKAILKVKTFLKCSMR